MIEELLPIEQVESFKKIFKLFCDEHQDMIPISQLGTVMRAVGHNPTDAEIEQYTQEFDPDSNGFIDYECFQALVVRRLKKDDREEELMEAFKAFDSENSGVIKSDDFRQAFLVLNRDLSQEDVEEMMKTFDSEQTGEFSYISIVKDMIALQSQPGKKEKKKGKKKKK